MGYVQNAEELACTPLRAHALALVEAALSAIDTRAVMRAQVAREPDGTLVIAGRRYPATSFRRLLVGGVGKCALDAAYALEEILGERIDDGVVVDVRCDSGILKRIRSCEGTHPYPSDANVLHTRELLTLLESATEDDLIILIISGGGSTLLFQPQSHTCVAEEELIRALFSCGVTIAKLNTVRKHLSLARGGHLAAAAHPARLEALIFSDVPGDDLSVISSGPTILDTSTVADARSVLSTFACAPEGFDPAVLFETPKDPACFATTRNTLALTNQAALSAMERVARERGLSPRVVSATLEGDANAVAQRFAHELKRMGPGEVWLYGGETTVEITGEGEGGRNQHLALAALPALTAGELVLTVASDGRDKSDNAGAIADTTTQEAAREAGLDPHDFLTRCDSFTFFHRVHQGVVTGYTGSNVSDLYVLLKE